jgi:hypothetical protein
MSGPPASGPPGGAEAVARGFGRALLEGEPRAAASYFCPEGTILTPDGTEIVGRRAVAEVLGQITASEQELEIRVGRTLVNRDIAVNTQFWRRRRGPHDSRTVAWLVLARGGDGWKIVIASPWEEAGGGAEARRAAFRSSLLS